MAAFTGFSPVGTGNNALNLRAFERPDGTTVVIYYDNSDSHIRVIKYDPGTGLWTGPPVGASFSESPIELDSVDASMDPDSGDIMVVWGESPLFIYAKRLYANDTYGTKNFINDFFPPHIFIPSARVTNTGPGKWTAVFCERRLLADHYPNKVIAIDFDDATGNWTNERVYLDRSLALSGPGELINEMQLSYDYAGSELHLCWAETGGGIASGAHGSGDPILTENNLGTGTFFFWAPTYGWAFAHSKTDSRALYIQEYEDPDANSHYIRYRIWDGTTWGAWSAPFDSETGVGSNLLMDENSSQLGIDSEGNAHLVYTKKAASDAWNSMWYVVFRQFEPPSTPVEWSLPAVPSVQYAAGCTEFASDQMYVFGVVGVTSLYWNVCPDCILVAPKNYGSVFEVDRNGVSVSEYEIAIGRAAVWAGGPLTSGDEDVIQTGAAGEILMDESYAIEADGTLSVWLFWRGSTAVDAIPVDGLALLVIRGASDTVVHRVTNSEVIPAGGPAMYELPADSIEVQAGDRLGLWMKGGISNSIRASLAPQGPAQLNRYQNQALPSAGSNLPAPTTTENKVLTLAARGVVVEETILQVGYYSDNTSEDSDSYLDFTLSTDAWADTNVVTPANLFDGSDSSVATVLSGNTGNVYYRVGELRDEEEDVPVERVEIKLGAVPAGGAVRVHISKSSASNDLAGAQSISDWEQMAEADDTWPTSTAFCLKIGRRARWIRLEIVGGTSLQTDVGAFEMQATMKRVEDGAFPPNPTSSLKDRFWFDQEAHRTASQIRGELDAAIAQGGTTLDFVAATPGEFFDQFEAGDPIYLFDGERGSRTYAQSVVALVEKAAKRITLSVGCPSAFSAGAKVAPIPRWFQARGKDASGDVVARTPWTPTIGVDPGNWVRSHGIFTGDT